MSKINKTFEFFLVFGFIKTDTLEKAKRIKKKMMSKFNYTDEDIFKVKSKIINYDKYNNVIYEDIEKIRIKI